jgi:hypothetical protein
MKYTIKPSDVYSSWKYISDVLIGYSKLTGRVWEIIDFRPPKNGEISIANKYDVILAWRELVHKSESDGSVLPKFIIAVRKEVENSSIWE